MALGRGIATLLISIHAPAGGATEILAARAPAAPFQFTPLREGRRKNSARPKPTGIFQFTPLREGRRTQNANF